MATRGLVVLVGLLSLACGGVTVSATDFTPEEFLTWVINDQADHAWAALDRSCRNTIPRADFDQAVTQLHEIALAQPSASFLSMDDEVQPDGTVHRRYHFERDFAAPRPVWLIRVPLGPSGKACGFSFDMKPRTDMRKTLRSRRDGRLGSASTPTRRTGRPTPTSSWCASSIRRPSTATP